MSGRKKSAADSSTTEPFNNPFRSSLRKLGRTLRKTVVSTPAPVVRERESAVVEEQPRSDQETFLDAVDGAVPLDERGGRVRVREEMVASAEGESYVREQEVALDLTADEHFDVRFSDRHIRGRSEGVSRETVAKLERGEFAVRSHVDLHGMALDDARKAVDEFLAERQRRGDRCVLVITGKGRNSRHQVGVLREGIPEWLARGPSARRLLAFATARPCDGGEGAFYVLLRKRPGRKTHIDVEAGGGA